jgi:gas vesicle protein
METGKIVLGALAGFAVGAVVGVLLAPDKGSETRRKIAQKGTDFVDGIKGKFSDLKNKYNDIVDELADKIATATHTEHHYTRMRETDLVNQVQEPPTEQGSR